MKIIFDENTSKALSDMLSTKTYMHIRIEVTRVGCGKPSLDLAVDTLKSNDLNVSAMGISFLVDKNSFLINESIEIKYNPDVYVKDFYVHTID